MNKKVIIGIDGVPFDLIDEMSRENIMPNFQKLKNTGVFTKMRSAIPEISSVAWSSIITGKNPAEHGIYGFTELKENSYDLGFPNFSNLKSPAFWHQNSDKRHVIINVPSTFPVQMMNGVHISGFVSLDLASSVYPRELLPKLEEFDYRVDVDSSLGHQSMDLFLEDLVKTNEARIKTYQYLWENESWDVFMLVFTGSDRIEHFLMDAYLDKNHKYHNDFLNYFRRVDEVIGEIADRLDEDDGFIILSDHGMEEINTNFFVNKFLEEKGYLTLDPTKQGYNKIEVGTKAFALDPGRIHINLKEKYPNGGEFDEDSLISELKELFLNAEFEGEKIIRFAFEKHEIYEGPLIDKAADLILVPNKGFRLRGTIEAENVFGNDVFSGDHSLDDAFLFVKCKNSNIVPEKPTVEDVVSIINNL
jgi:predicted AlkP superfamily phosphohydrolase/phosphomutase